MPGFLKIKTGFSGETDFTDDFTYQISDKDEAGDIKYYGYLNFEGGYILMQWDTITDTFRYAIGASDYQTAWTNRATIEYKYYDALTS